MDAVEFTFKGGVTTTFAYDAENKLTGVTINGAPTPSFVRAGVSILAARV